MEYTTPGYYVLDDLCPLGILEAIVSGPFSSPGAADTDLKTVNIAGDCAVYYLDRAKNIIRRV